jgi:hypothetical protein
MNKPKSPEYALSIRWGTFSLSIVGRGPILAWLAALASLIGIKLLL